MKNFRQSPPDAIDGIKIEKVHDLQVSKIFSVSSGQLKEVADIALPKSNVLQFMLEDGSKVSVRPSGTEPKIKFYFSVCERVSDGINDEELSRLVERCKGRLEKIEKSMVGLAD